MKVKTLCKIQSARGVIPAGQIIDITPALLERLAGKVALLPVDQTGQATDDSILVLWRWFALEADRVYRSSPKAADSWAQHKRHKVTALELCKTGDIQAARLELERALEALRGATIAQPVLPGG